jgi:DNA (cytosine-5)-methyltransferase 1
MLDAHDVFAGPGGWDVAATVMGMKVLGLEINPDACKTRRAEGLDTIEGDVRKFGPALLPRAEGLIASPPCPTFSRAGLGTGRQSIPDILEAVAEMGRQMGHGQYLFEDERTELVLEPLRWALEAIREGIPYRWLAFEQVPDVLPVWQAMAEVLRGYGYSVDVDNLYAEQFGVPQTRKRAILVARYKAPVKLPTPTHSRFHNRTPDKLDVGVLPWVSMAEALGWGMTHRPYPTIAAGTASGGADPGMLGGSGARKAVSDERGAGRWALRNNTSAHAAVRDLEHPAPSMYFGARLNSMHWEGQGERMPGEALVGFPRRYDNGSGGWLEIDGTKYRARDLRSSRYPSQVVTEKARSWQAWLVQSAQERATKRHEDQPAMTITAGHDWAERRWNVEWPADYPAPTVAGDPRISPRGCKHPGPGCCTQYPGKPGAQFSTKSIRITQQEAALLQSFPANYQWQGTKTSQFQQIGNAIPPILSRAVLTAARS